MDKTLLVSCLLGLTFSVSAKECVSPDGFTSVSEPLQWHSSTQTKTVNLVNLWAIWCPPCLKELPMLDSLGDSQQFSVETVHVGNNPNEISARFAQLDIQSLPKTIEPDYSLLQKFGFQGLPATMVVVKNEVKYRHSGFIKVTHNELSNWLTCLSEEKK